MVKESKFRIKNKKDWCIAGIFSFLVLYLTASHFQFPINQILMGVTSFRISSFNQPEDQGAIVVAIVLTTILGIVALVLHRKSKQVILLFGGIGLFLTILVMASYYIECHLILTSVEDLQPSSVDMWCYDDEAVATKLTLTEEMQEAVLDKVINLETEKGRVYGEAANEGLKNIIEISIWYPKRYNHSYVISVTLTEQDIIYARYNYREKDPVVKDNGLRDLVNKIVDNQS